MAGRVEGLDVNSPRTLEACLHRGLLVEELLPRKARSFGAPDMSREVAERRYEFFEKRRLDKISMVQVQREEIVRQHKIELESHRSPDPLSTVGVPPGVGSPESAAGASSSVSLLEMKRIEAIKKRQAKELARMIQGEQKMSELQSKLLHTEAEEKARVAANERKKAESRAKLEAKNKERLERMADAVREEESKSKSNASREKDRESNQVEEEAAAKRSHALAMRTRDFERSTKLVEQARRSEVALNHIQELAEESQIKMQEREAKLSEMLLTKKECKKDEIQLARAKAEKRIARALEHNRKRQQDERETFAKKQQDAAVRAREKAEEDALRAQKAVIERAEKDVMRAERLEDAVMRRKERRNKILEERKHREHYYDSVTELRRDSLSTQKLESELENIARRESVARIRRVDDFHRLQLLQKVQLDDARSARIKLDRAALVDQRKHNSHEAFLRKHRIRTAMDQMRITNKFISLDSIIDGPGGSKRKQFIEGDLHAESAPQL